MEAQKKVIIVDDDVYFLQSTKERLIDDGYNAITADSISKAKQIISEQPDADVIVLDIMMPPDGESDLETQRGYKSGLVLARWIKQKFPKMAIIGISGVKSLDTIEWFERNNIPFFNKGSGEFIEGLNKILNRSTMSNDPHHMSSNSPLNKFHNSAPLASWIFGGLILLFLMLVVFVDISPSKFPIVRFLMALSAAFFALFFVGGVLLEGTLRGLYISATGGFVLFILIQFVFNPFEVLPTAIPHVGSNPSGNVVATFEPPSSINSADLVIKTESGQVVVTISIKSHTHQTISLPPGNYMYELTNITQESQSGPPPCYTYISNARSGNFIVDKNKDNKILLPELSKLSPIPGCSTSGTEPTVLPTPQNSTK